MTKQEQVHVQKQQQYQQQIRQEKNLKGQSKTKLQQPQLHQQQKK